MKSLYEPWLFQGADAPFLTRDRAKATVSSAWRRPTRPG
jgi:hypothetical protein